jgi:DNA replication licensing factor MCM6
LTQEEADDHEVGCEDGYDEEAMMTKLFERLNETEILEIKRIKEHPKVYENLAESLFDEIFGHIEIKKALLLQLLGGVHKKTSTKISLRGDINILIVGDPSTAKSQFLKCVDKFVPRSVYTNGKTTTAAGLTASVVRDP